MEEEIQRHPKNLNLRILLATDYFQLKEYAKCLSESTICLQLGCSDTDLYFMRAISYHKLGQQNLAEQSILKVAYTGTNDPFTQFRCGQLFSQISAIPQAIARFSYALTLQPDIAEVYLERAEAFEKLGEYKKEIDDYDAVIKLNPHQAQYYNNRAWVRNKIGNDFDKAIEDCNKAISIDSNVAATYKNRAVAYMAKGNFLSAKRDLDKSLALDQSSKWAGKTYYLRSLVHKKLGNDDLSKDDEKKSQQLDYDPKKD